MNTKEAKLCYEIALLRSGYCSYRTNPEKAKQMEDKIEKLTDELICLGLDQYEE